MYEKYAVGANSRFEQWVGRYDRVRFLVGAGLVLSLCFALLSLSQYLVLSLLPSCFLYLHISVLLWLSRHSFSSRVISEGCISLYA